MRIIIDPVPETSPHALSRGDVKTLLASVPPSWTRHIQTIHLGSTLPEHCRFPRPVIYSQNRLNVYSRGLKPDKARQEVLRELAVHGLSIQTRYGHKLSAEELRRVDEAIRPLLNKLRAQAAQTSLESDVSDAKEHG